MSKKEFYKITYQDIDIALDFFDGNELHFSEFLLATTKYYRGQIHIFKYKIVEKYFRTYKKTMDFIIEAKKTGKIGGIKAFENQSNNNETLTGSIEGTITPLIDTLPPNNKLLNSNNKEEIKKIDFNVFWDLYDRKKGAKKKCIKKWDSLDFETQTKIIEIIPNFLKTIKDKQFQPYPETFLNNERWDDEIEIEKNTNERPSVWDLKNKITDGYYTEQEAMQKYNYDFKTNKFID
jgi:hypothetical protein